MPSQEPLTARGLRVRLVDEEVIAELGRDLDRLVAIQVEEAGRVRELERQVASLSKQLLQLVTLLRQEGGNGDP